MIGEFLNFLADAVFGFLNGIIGIFPQMPFEVGDYLDLSGVEMVHTILSWVNWFLPLDVAAAIIALWCTAMLAYLAVKMAMRYSEGIVK